MKRFVVACMCVLLFAGAASVAHAAKKYDLYEYNPLEVRMRWVYGLCSKQATGEIEVDAEVIGEEEYEGVLVKRLRLSDGWVDLVEQSEEGLKVYKSVYGKNEKHGTSIPPAIQSPRYAEVGVVHRYKSQQDNFGPKGDSPINSVTVARSYTLLAEEDVTVPAGTYKGCLKAISEVRYFTDNFIQVHRQILLGWYAKGVGLVKAIKVDFGMHDLGRMEEVELKEFITAAEAIEREKEAKK